MKPIFDLEFDSREVYCKGMYDPTIRSAHAWQSDLDRGDQEIAAGQVVSMAPGRARLREAIAELKTKKANDRRRKVTPGL